MQTSLTLSNGSQIPVVGLGTWRSPNNQVGQAVEYALTRANYKHIDCASVYQNEAEIGRVFAQVIGSKQLSRSEVFITSKLWNTDHHPSDVHPALQKTLHDLQLSYLDLYLMHWGVAFANLGEKQPRGDDGRVITQPVSVQQTWQAMEKLVDQGLVKAIGVANFTVAMLVDLLTYARIRPAVNQVEIHAYHSQPELVDFCQSQKIVVTAYSPLASPGNFTDLKPKLIEDSVVAQIAKEMDKSVPQVLIRHAIERGLVVIPKSNTPVRIKENIEVFDFELSELQLHQLNQLNRNMRVLNPAEGWKLPYFA